MQDEDGEFGGGGAEVGVHVDHVLEESYEDGRDGSFVTSVGVGEGEGLVEERTGGEEPFGGDAGFGSEERRDVAEFGIPLVEEVEVFF